MINVIYYRYYLFFLLRGLLLSRVPWKLSRLEQESSSVSDPSTDDGEGEGGLCRFFLLFLVLLTLTGNATGGAWDPISLGTHVSVSKSHMSFRCTCLQCDGVLYFFLGLSCRDLGISSSESRVQQSGSGRYLAGMSVSPRRTGKCRTSNVSIISCRCM